MPIPVAAYDPTRRIFIGGLAPQTTTKDIIAVIKTKTKSLPTHVEIALAKKLNTNQKERDPFAPAPAITRRRKPKIKIPGCSSSSDDDEILQMNYNMKKNADDQQQQQQDQQGGSDNDNNNDDDDANNTNKKRNNNNKKQNNNNTKSNAGGEKKPLRDCRGFAHVTVEGLKQVAEQLQGVLVNDKPIRVEPAKPHYLWKLDKVRRIQEKEEEKKKSEVESIRSKEGYGELDYTKPLIRSTVAAKRKFGNIASQIAAKLREKAKERKLKLKQQMLSGGGALGQQRFGAVRRQREDDGSAAPGYQAHTSGSSAKAKVPFNNANSRNNSNNFKGGKFEKKPAAAAAPPPPPPPPEPTKTDRKLSALEARLAALQAKLTKKK